MKKERYDLFIPFGSFCNASHHLRNNKLQYCSLPFDWLQCLSITYATDLVCNEFKDFMLKENLEILKDVKSKRYYTDKKFGINFNHDFRVDEDFNEAYDIAIDKYRRRIKRLFSMIDEADSIMLVHSHRGDIDINEAKLSIERLEAKFPGKKFNFIAIEIKDTYNEMTKESFNNIYYVRVNGDTEEKWFGNEALFSEIVSKYDLTKKGKKAATIAKFKMAIKTIVCFPLYFWIPSKKIRRKIKTRLGIR